MKNILQILKQIEEEYKLKILYACETGSRAWGFPSPDSDFDIRFIYMHERNWYLFLNERKDTIEFMLNDELDITGWDLKKSLLLLKKSNASLIERFQSPVEYYAAGGFKDAFKTLINEYYSPVAVFYHHHSLAIKFWEDIKDQQTVKLKQYFYLVRSMLSCNWILKNQAVLPMHMEGLMELIDEKRKNDLRTLIKLKATVGEKYLHQRDEDLHTWLAELWSKINGAKNDFDAKTTSYNSLNDFFIKTLNENADNRLG
jgi:predicted nucleotidyltransferase